MTEAREKIEDVCIKNKGFDILKSTIGENGISYDICYYVSDDGLLHKSVKVAEGYHRDREKPSMIAMSCPIDRQINNLQLYDTVQAMDKTILDSIRKGETAMCLMYSHSWSYVGVVDGQYVYTDDCILNSSKGYVFNKKHNMEEITKDLREQVETLIFAGNTPNIDLLDVNENPEMS